MNRNHLQIFRAVVDAGSFTAAAEALLISQPAVSLQVAELERSTKTKLLDRLPRGVRPTEPGRVLADYARRIASLERDAEQALRAVTGVEAGRLSIGASLTVGSYLLPRVLGQFAKQHPRIELAVDIANSRVVQQRLVAGEIDLALTEGPPGGDAVTAAVFSEDDLVPIVSPGHALTTARRITPAQFCDAGLIMREPGSGTREVVERALAKLGVDVHPKLTLGGIEAIKSAVSAGVGVAIVSRLSLARERLGKSLAIVEVAGWSVRRPLYRLSLPNHTPSPAAEAMVRMLTQAKFK